MRDGSIKSASNNVGECVISGSRIMVLAFKLEFWRYKSDSTIMPHTLHIFVVLIKEINPMIYKYLEFKFEITFKWNIFPFPY